MAILLHSAIFFLQEHKHRPIAGDIVTIGRQTVTLTYEEALALLEMEGMSRRFGATVALDGVSLKVKPGDVHAIDIPALYSKYAARK